MVAAALLSNFIVVNVYHREHVNSGNNKYNYSKRHLLFVVHIRISNKDDTNTTMKIQYFNDLNAGCHIHSTPFSSVCPA